MNTHCSAKRSVSRNQELTGFFYYNIPLRCYMQANVEFYSLYDPLLVQRTSIQFMKGIIGKYYCSR